MERGIEVSPIMNNIIHCNVHFAFRASCLIWNVDIV